MALKFFMDICICFLKNPIDFGGDLLKIDVFRLYCRFCVIWSKFVYWVFFYLDAMQNKNLEQASINSRHQNL